MSCRLGDGGVTLQWQGAASGTFSAPDGFNIYRASQAAGPFEQTGTVSIPPGSGSGASFTYEEQPGPGTWFYEVTAFTLSPDAESSPAGPCETDMGTPTATPTPTATMTSSPTLTPTPMSLTLGGDSLQSGTSMGSDLQPLVVTNTFTKTPTRTITRTFTKTPTPTRTATATATPQCFLVDNLEDGNLIDFYQGTWAGYGWGGGAFNNPPAVVTPGAAGTNDSVEETGSNNSSSNSDGFGILATLNAAAGGTANLGGYFQGLSFYVKASRAATLRAELVSSTDQSSGNTDYYGYNFTVGTSWQQVVIPASSFATVGYGTTGSFSSELANAVQFQWQTQNSAYSSGMSFWVDEVCIQTNNPPSPIPTSTFTPSPTKTPTPTPAATATRTFTQTPTVTPTFTPQCFQVDNLEDGNLVNFYQGVWAGYGWNGGTFNNPPAVVTPGAAGTNDSVEETGSNTSTTNGNGFGILTTLNAAAGGTVNLGGYFQGLSFYVKASQAATLRVELVSSTDQSSGNTDYYGYNFTVGTSWQQV
ncbi:MAG TPA: carbohydrate binding domain-containing protein, partial [bacterium]|nr:carbohydrate binding domain-containing protein [bacterium]